MWLKYVTLSKSEHGVGPEDHTMILNQILTQRNLTQNSVIIYL